MLSFALRTFVAATLLVAGSTGLLAQAVGMAEKKTARRNLMPVPATVNWKTGRLTVYVTMYSPLQMAADLSENYDRFPDAFQFIRDVAVDWDDTHIIDAEPGDHVSIARKAKGKDEWYVGAITDENSRQISVPFRFLARGRKYLTTIYSDASGAHWERNPQAYKIESFIVDSNSVLELFLAEGGGAAISLKPATAADVKKYKPAPRR